nr:Uncharacterised protein [Providencia rettgeri]
MKIRNIDKLNKNDFIKLSSIHSSIGKGDDFDSWFEESVSSKKDSQNIVFDLYY